MLAGSALISGFVEGKKSPEKSYLQIVLTAAAAFSKNVGISGYKESVLDSAVSVQP